LNKILSILLLFTLINVFTVFPQSTDETDYKPLWLRLDDAIQLFDEGESGEAVYQFRKILEKFPGNPESEMWLGFIFDKENEYELASKYLELALQHKKQLMILEDQYQILYKLSDINLKEGNINSYAEILKSIIELSGEGPGNRAIELAMLNVMENRGYDKFIELYRPYSRISLKAFGLLGKYYYEKGDWETAIKYLMWVTGSIINTSIEQLKLLEPEYSFLIEESTDKSLENVFDKVKENPVLKDYFFRNSFYEYFYYLGKSLVKANYKDSGSYILEKLYVRPETGKWGSLSNLK